MKPMKSTTSRYGNLFSKDLKKIQNELKKNGIIWNQSQHLPVDKFIQFIDQKIEESEQLLHWIHPTKHFQLHNNNETLRELKQTLLNLDDFSKKMQVPQHPLPMTSEQVIPTRRKVKIYQQTTDQQSTLQTSQQSSLKSSKQTSPQSSPQSSQQQSQQSSPQSSTNIQQAFQQFVDIHQEISQIELQIEQNKNKVKNSQQKADEIIQSSQKTGQLTSRSIQQYQQIVETAREHQQKISQNELRLNKLKNQLNFSTVW